jgi:hypothetical protein
MSTALHIAWLVLRKLKWPVFALLAGTLWGFKSCQVLFVDMPVEIGRYFAQRAVVRLATESRFPAGALLETGVRKDSTFQRWLFTYAIPSASCGGAQAVVAIDRRGDATLAVNAAFQRCVSLRVSI